MPNNDFIISYSEYYKKFIEGLASSIKLLADIQEKFKDDYNKIKEFNTNPKSIEELLEKLSPEEQGILFKLLLKSGIIGKKISGLFEMTVEEQRTFSNELETFSGEINKSILDIMKVLEKK